MNQISSADLHHINGGLYNFVAGAVIGYGIYGFKQNLHDQPITVAGALTAAAFGAMSSGLGSLAAEAAGGGMVGNLAWRPGFTALNTAGQAIAKEQ